ncbi:hypothetical protein [Microbacterium sp. No. 7]|uniref:hypothetical protein n=1 Tax=Microbacterium sp. No. 7 TaxID=1714373 RepID=UPI0006ECE358|nr:hypothetical protein [Microbacterium sp. No. 7]ALJ20317.1 hypothetical protein AOA12_10500 [Microbacterium sp. No. 7]
MSVRTWLRDELTVPAGWAWIDEQRLPDVITKTTVATKHTRIEPLEEGSIGQLRHEVVLSVFAPHTRVGDAEDALDDAVTTLVQEIDASEQIRFVSAEKVVTENGQYFGWDLTLSVITNPEPDPEPDPEPEEA